MMFLKAFLIGGLICVVGQLLLDLTKLTPARILVGFVGLGVILGGIGVYKYVEEFAGAGATVPLLGFGALLADGTKTAIEKDGFIGIFTGGITGTAGGIAAAIFFGYMMAVVFTPKPKP
jgi:stage V sporulation protein AE